MRINKFISLTLVFCLSNASAEERNSGRLEPEVQKHEQEPTENSLHTSNPLSEFQTMRLEQMQIFTELTLSAAKKHEISDQLLKKMMQINEKMRDLVKRTPELVKKKGTEPLTVRAESLKSNFKNNPHGALIELYSDMVPGDPFPGEPYPTGVDLSPAEKHWLTQLNSNIASKIAETSGILINSKQIQTAFDNRLLDKLNGNASSRTLSCFVEMVMRYQLNITLPSKLSDAP